MGMKDNTETTGRTHYWGHGTNEQVLAADESATGHEKLQHGTTTWQGCELGLVPENPNLTQQHFRPIYSLTMKATGIALLSYRVF